MVKPLRGYLPIKAATALARLNSHTLALGAASMVHVILGAGS